MALNEFRREVAILKACRDPNIVAFLVRASSAVGRIVILWVGCVAVRGHAEQLAGGCGLGCKGSAVAHPCARQRASKVAACL